jgi:hypothetical protein
MIDPAEVARTPEPADPDPVRGRCFVVCSEEGRYWDGARWVDDWRNALQFRGAGDPYSDCALVAESLRREGARCGVSFVPTRKS